MQSIIPTIKARHPWIAKVMESGSMSDTAHCGKNVRLFIEQNNYDLTEWLDDYPSFYLLRDAADRLLARAGMNRAVVTDFILIDNQSILILTSI